MLVGVQGTYARIQVQGYSADGTYRWETAIPRGSRGARTSHNCPVVDYDGDGNDEFFLGERCLRFKDGTPLLIADEHVWDGHSDVISPFRDGPEAPWHLFTARESPYAKPAPPRVVAYGPDGRRIWTALEEGHMDMGWVAWIAPGRWVAYALRLGGKRAGPQGFERHGEEFFWDPFTGAPLELPVSVFERFPVDIDGDGLMELIPSSGMQSPDDIVDAEGRVLAVLPDGSRVAHASRFVDSCLGEQLLTFEPQGAVRIWGVDAPNNAPVPDRFLRHFYQRNRKLSAVGYNYNTLSGDR